MATRHFPVRIGRSTRSDIQLEDPAVWDEHVEVQLGPENDFIVAAHLHAPATINGDTISQSHSLRNGDVLGIGSVKLQFWLPDPGQRGLSFREWLTWIGIAMICAGQVALIYWLLST